MTVAAPGDKRGTSAGSAWCRNPDSSMVTTCALWLSEVAQIVVDTII